MTSFAQPGATIGAILLARAVVAWIETVIPLHYGARASRAHLGPNLALTFITFATNIFLNIGVVVALALLGRLGFGILNVYRQPPLASAAAAVLGLDLSFYVAHVAMHKIPAFWRYHLVHHCDPVVDVTTTIRQHPGESVIRYAVMRHSHSCSGLPRPPSPCSGPGRPSTVSWSTRTSGFPCGSMTCWRS